MKEKWSMLNLRWLYSRQIQSILGFKHNFALWYQIWIALVTIFRQVDVKWYFRPPTYLFSTIPFKTPYCIPQHFPTTLFYIVFYIMCTHLYKRNHSLPKAVYCFIFIIIKTKTANVIIATSNIICINSINI